MIPVFVYCIWIGKRFAKRSVGHWLSFFFFPVLFSIAALFVLLLLQNSLCWVYYLISLLSGSLVGLFITNRLSIKVDTVSQQISAHGSWLIMFCLLTLCVWKCAFDILKIMLPLYSTHLSLIGFVVKGSITGLLYGQALSFWYRFSIAEKCSPLELSRGRFAFFRGLTRVSNF